MSYRRRPSARPRLQRLEDRCNPAPALALSNNTLIAFDTLAPGNVQSTTAVTGLNAGDNLVGIDFRPQNGFLYGLGYNSAAGTVRLYNVSFRTGVATAVGAAPAGFVDASGTPVPITGTNFGFDFNPAVDRIRVVNDAGQDFRINPNTGAFIDGDLGGAAMSVPGLNMDGAINGPVNGLDAAAYTNNQQNTTVTTLYTLSAAADALYIQNPPNSGTQTATTPITLNGARLDFAAANGFDIAPNVNVASSNAQSSGVGVAALTVGGATGLYAINLTTGAATLLGPVGNGAAPVQGLAVNAPAVLGGLPSIALGTANTITRFNTGSATSGRTVPVLNITAGEVLVGIDWRPATGQLYGLGYNAAAGSATLYLIDPQNPTMMGMATATVVGTAGGVANGMGMPISLAGATAFGFDFNPTVDRIRVVTDNGLNFRVNPNDGTVVMGMLDGAINGLPAGSTGVTGAAYTNSFGQVLVTSGNVTSQYVLDPTSGMLFIQAPPNAGTLTQGVQIRLDSVDGPPLLFTAVNGFDIPGGVRVTAGGTQAAGQGFAVLTVNGQTALYAINLTTGVASLIGPVADGSAGLAGLAVGDGLAGSPVTRLTAVGAGPGGGPVVNVYNPDGSIRFSFFAFNPIFTGGVTVVTADLNYDGVDDIIVGAGPGGGPVVSVFSGVDLTPFGSFFALPPQFAGGVFVAADQGQIVVGAGAGGGPVVSVFAFDLVTGQTALTNSFFAFPAQFGGGVRVATGAAVPYSRESTIPASVPFNLAVGAGPGAGPIVSVFDLGTLAFQRSFFAFAPSFTGGVFVVAGRGDIAVGAGEGGGPVVSVFAPDGTVRLSGFVFNPVFTGGVRIGRGTFGGRATLVAGAGVGGPPLITEFDAFGVPVNSFFAFDPSFLGGVFVG